MREILFRGKTKESGEWVQGYFVYAKSDFDSEECREADIIPHDTDRVYKGEYNVVFPCIPKTIGQYTGLIDKNGKKIFEGDIVNIEYPETTVKKCVIEYVGASFVGSTLADNWELDGYYSLEVIGNIHDNPELLEGENDKL